MIKLYLLMTLMSGSVAASDVETFDSLFECNLHAERIVDEKMATGRYDKIEAKCAPIGAFEL